MAQCSQQSKHATFGWHSAHCLHEVESRALVHGREAADCAPEFRVRDTDALHFDHWYMQQRHLVDANRVLLPGAGVQGRNLSEPVASPSKHQNMSDTLFGIAREQDRSVEHGVKAVWRIALSVDGVAIRQPTGSRTGPQALAEIRVEAVEPGIVGQRLATEVSTEGRSEEFR